MNIKESAENYLETIYMLSKQNPNVRSIDVASELEYTKPSVSVAMKKLRESGHVVMDEDGHIKLTEKGLEIAEKMYERHKLLSDLLISIGIDEETAVSDACKIEHVISIDSFDKIKAFAKERGIDSK